MNKEKKRIRKIQKEEKWRQERTVTILEYRIKGYTLQTIGNILHLSRARISKIIEAGRENPIYKDLYSEVDKTIEFLNRETN